MEYGEQPEHPFTLFNLGSSYLELNRAVEELPLLEKSLARSESGDSIEVQWRAAVAEQPEFLQGWWVAGDGWWEEGVRGQKSWVRKSEMVCVQRGFVLHDGLRGCLRLGLRGCLRLGLRDASPWLHAV
jgi:hypothetical protein